MKYYKRLKVYKNSTGSCVFDPHNMIATSYGWWAFLKQIGPFTVFNNYKYSPTTSRHQRQVKLMLDKHGIEVDLWVSTYNHLNLTYAVIGEIKRDIKSIRRTILKKGTKKKKNRERRQDIRQLISKIRMLQSALRLEDRFNEAA